MKNNYISTILLLLSINLYSQSWNYVGNAGLSESTANHLSLDIDLPSGDLFLAFQDLNFDGKLTLIKYTEQNNDWDENPLISSSSIGYANFIDLQIDDAGLVNLSFIDGGFADSLTIIRQSNSGDFFTEGTYGNGSYSSGYGINTIIRKDNNNTRYVVSYAGNNVQFLNDNSNWNTSNIVNNINITELSFDFIYGTGYVAYSNLNDAGKIDIQKLSQTEITETYDNISDGLANYIDLVINPLTLVPYVAFQDLANSGKVTVKKLNGDTWELVGEEAFTDGLANYVDLAFDSNGVPYVAFQDVSFSNKLSVMSFNGTSWNYVGDRGISSSSASYSSIKLNSNGEVFVAFKDGSVGNKASVMRYGVTAGVDDQNQLDISIYPNPTSDIVYIEGNYSQLKAVVYDILGKQVMNKPITNSIDISQLEKGVYILQLSDGVKLTTQRIIKN